MIYFDVMMMIVTGSPAPVCPNPGTTSVRATVARNYPVGYHVVYGTGPPSTLSCYQDKIGYQESDEPQTGRPAGPEARRAEIH